MSKFQNLWYEARQLRTSSVIESASVNDLWRWAEVNDHLPNLTALNDTMGGEVGGQPIRDGFWQLHNPEVALQNPSPVGLEGLTALMNRAMNVPQWESLRRSTKGDVVASGFAVPYYAEFWKNLPEEVKEELQQAAQAAQEAQDAQNAADTAQSAYNSAMQGGNETAQANAEAQLQEAVTNATEAAARARQAGEQAAAAVEGRKHTIDNNAQQTANAAQKEAEGMKQYVRSFSLAAGGDPEQRDVTMFRDAMRLLAQRPNLRKLVNLIGWQRRMLQVPRRRAPVGRARKVGVVRKPLDLATVLPDELMGVALPPDDPMAIDFLFRAATGQIKHYKYEGEESVGLGPVILVVDQSGSMGGDNEALAVLLEWTIMELCIRDNRPFWAIPFSGAGEFHIWQPPRQQGKVSSDSVFRHLSHSYKGGTEPYQPLLAALDIIGKEREARRADIVFVTDGYIPVAPPTFLHRLNAVRAQRPTKIIATIIESRQNAGWADKIFYVADLFAERDIFLNVAREVF